MSPDKWVRRWKVPSSSGHGDYTVAVDAAGNYGCSCKRWTSTVPRVDCKHIRDVKGGNYDPIDESSGPKAGYVLAMVRKPTYHEDTNELYIPLLRLPDTIMMEATIVAAMLKHGYTMNEIRDIRHHIPKEWTRDAVLRHVDIHGEAEYPPEPKRPRTKARPRRRAKGSPSGISGVR